jgi:hypothetical protein
MRRRLRAHAITLVRDAQGESQATSRQMFAIWINVHYRDDAPTARRQARSGFTQRREAESFLDRMIAGRTAGTAGYDQQHGYWWTRVNDVVTRYTIEAAPTPDRRERDGR